MFYYYGFQNERNPKLVKVNGAPKTRPSGFKRQMEIGQLLVHTFVAYIVICAPEISTWRNKQFFYETKGENNNTEG